MISGYAFYGLYSVVKLHFTTKYDIFKYKEKSSSFTRDTYEVRNDADIFAGFGREMKSSEEALQFCVFNFLYSQDWLYGLYQDARDKYLDKKRFYSTFTDNIKREHEFIGELQRTKNISFAGLTEGTRSGNQPPLFQLYVKNNVSPEFCCVSDVNNNFINKWVTSSDPLIKSEAFKLMKYKPFVLKFK